MLAKAVLVSVTPTLLREERKLQAHCEHELDTFLVQNRSAKKFDLGSPLQQASSSE